MRNVDPCGDVRMDGTGASSDEDSNSSLTAANDGFVRMFDVREPTPKLTIDAGERSEFIFSALYVHVNGIPGTDLLSV